MNKQLIALCLVLFCYPSSLQQLVKSDTIEGNVGTEQLILFESENVLNLGTAKERPEWDSKGYIMFCPCMGRFGNQAAHYIGALAFAKAIDRTIVLPAFRTYINVPFSDWFLVEPLKEFHRVITMEDFISWFAEDYWPVGSRKGFCWLPLTSPNECKMKDGNPFGPFWDGYKIDFDDYVKFQMNNQADMSNPQMMERMKQEWLARFPPSEYPVLAFRGAPAAFPVKPGNRYLQKYLRWNPTFFAPVEEEMQKRFKGEKFVGIHLRNGVDWERACEHADGSPKFMASPQCLESTGNPVTKAMCFPSLNHILELTQDAVKSIGAKHLYIATDDKPHIQDFERILSPLKVEVHHLNPHLPQIDLMILGQADLFIGNCVSSFTSFVKRERDSRGQATAFWSFPL